MDEDEDSDDKEEDEEEDALNEDEREALAEDVDPDEASANKAELAGGQANSEVKADDKSSAVTAAAGKKEEKKPEFNHATFIAYAGHTGEDLWINNSRIIYPCEESEKTTATEELTLYARALRLLFYGNYK